MNFQEATQSGFQNYVNFQDRAQRSAYWYWVLFAFIVGTVANILDTVIFRGWFSPLSILTTLVLILPGIAVSVRRLHDMDRSGWWMLLLFIPIVGAIILIIWFCMRGTAGSNRFGPDPL
jgi:uncharacterized membrane protein YhaH (DUF805 family)